MQPSSGHSSPRQRAISTSLTFAQAHTCTQIHVNISFLPNACITAKRKWAYTVAHLQREEKKERWFIIWLIYKHIWAQTHLNKTILLLNVSLKHNGYAVCSVCIQLLGADTCYQEVEDKVIGRKDRLWTHRERECCCISDTAVISVSCDYVLTAEVRSPNCASEELFWKASLPSQCVLSDLEIPMCFSVMHAHTKTSSFPKTHDELSTKWRNMTVDNNI